HVITMLSQHLTVFKGHHNPSADVQSRENHSNVLIIHTLNKFHEFKACVQSYTVYFTVFISCHTNGVSFFFVEHQLFQFLIPVLTSTAENSSPSVFHHFFKGSHIACHSGHSYKSGFYPFIL